MLQLLENKIAVVPIRDPDMIGSLYIPDQAKERVDQGLVKYIGPDCKYGLSVGDHVLFSGYTGTLVALEGEGDLIILPEDFITCVIKDESWSVPGLFFRNDKGEYFEANYEIAMLILAKAYKKYKTLKVRHFEDQPKVSETEWH